MKSKKSVIKTAVIESLPLAIAVGAYGVSYGVLASQSDFTLIETVGMSVMVFSGSLQMVSLGLITSGAGIFNIILTSILLNLRNLLYGAALWEGLSKSGNWKYLLAYGVSDEPFVLGTKRFKEHGPDHIYFAGVLATFYIAWVGSSLIGALIGNQVDPTMWGLDLAFPLTFAAILISSVSNKPAVLTAITGVFVAVVMELIFPGNNLTIIVTGIISPFAGIYFNRRLTNNE